MFRSFRQLGCISTSTPFALLHSGSQHLIFVSIGHSWQVFDCDHLRVVFFGPNLSKRIRMLACDGDWIFAAVKGGIEVCKRVERVGFRAIRDARNVVQMVRIGPVLITLLDDDAVMVWKNVEVENLPMKEFKLEEGFRATCMTHLDTYVNKVLIGSENGALELWNFMLGEKLYAFNGWSSAIRTLEPSPALDVVGIGLSNGSIILYHVRCSEVLFKFHLSASKTLGIASGLESFSCLSFSSGVSIPALLASAGQDGEIVIWDLEKRELFSIKEDAHDAKIASLAFLPSTLTLVSSSEDNSLKQWIVDIHSKEIKLLRQRCGPKTPPLLLKFCQDGHNLLACDSKSSLWNLSIIQDQQNCQLSSKKATLTSRPLDLDTCSVRERDWGNVLTAHEGQKHPFLWSLKKSSLENHNLQPPTYLLKTGLCLQATAVAFSQCGNFGFVGYECGSLHKFNAQSGLHRGSYSRKNDVTAHKNRIVSIAADSLNQKVLSAGIDGYLRIWNFKRLSLLFEFSWGSAVSLMTIHAGNGLSTIALDDLSLQLFDFESYRIVRRFRGLKDRITCLQISSDGRWLLVSSMDRSLRIFDIPSTNQIQVMAFKSPILSFSLSASLEVLATAHLNQMGISLWVNQFVLGSVDPSNFMPRGILPDLDGSTESGQKLVKLALIPMGPWTIAHNSSIKERTQAVQPMIKTPEAPFFLPPLIALSKVEGPEEKTESQEMEIDLTVESEFMLQLQTFKKTEDRKTFLAFLKKQTVVYLEQEILSLSRDLPVMSEEDTEVTNVGELTSLLYFIEMMVEVQEDIEFIQALLKLVLQIHTPVFLSVDSLATQISNIQEKVANQWNRLEVLLDTTQCMASLFIGRHD